MSAPLHPLRRARLTVRGWLALVLGIMGVLVLLSAVVGAALLNRTDVVSRLLSQEIQPARVAAAQLQAALRDQETGIRGYLICRRPAIPRALLRGAASRTCSGRRHPAVSRWSHRADRRSGRHREGGGGVAVRLCRTADRQRDPQLSLRRQQPGRRPGQARIRPSAWAFRYRKTWTSRRRRRVLPTSSTASTVGATGCWAPSCSSSSAWPSCWAF